MRKLILTLLIVLLNQILFAQNKNQLISIEFKDVNRLTAIQAIEKASDYKFYFNPEWIESDKTLITENYSNVTIEYLLDNVLNNSNLNFFIQKNRIILTKNIAIYETLAPNFFGIDKKENIADKIEKTVESPVFFQQFDSTTTSRNKNNSGITLIGKEKINNDKKQYTLSGYIKNSETNKGIYNITIRVRNKNTNTVTDPEGYYQLLLPYGISYLETESLNHKRLSKRVMMYDNGKLDLKITEITNDLKEVIIKGKANKSVRTAITGVSTIDMEGIKNVPLVLGERDIFRIATTLPGIKTTGEGSAGYNVRGGKDDQNLILLDNATLYNTSHFLGFFSVVNPYTTSKVDIYKGSIPAQFGGRLSSVFDITSKKGNDEKLVGEGGIGTVTSNLTIGAPLIKGKSSILVGVRGTYSEWLLNSLNEESLKNSEASFYDGTAKYNYKINDNNNLQSTYYYSYDSFKISSDSLYKYSNRLFSLEYGHTFNSKNKAFFVFTNSQYKFDIDYHAVGNKSFNFGYKLNETQAILNFKSILNPKHNFNYGVSSKLYLIDPGHLFPSNSESIRIPIDIDDEKGLESSVFFSDNYNVTDRILINLGLRYSFFAALGESTQRIYKENSPVNDATVIDSHNYNNNEVIKTFDGFEPRLAIRYLFTDDFSIKASYDKTYQFIHLLTNNTTQSPTDAWKLSDLNVDPQESQQYSLGIYKNIVDDLLEISLEGYYKKSGNLLDYKVGGELVLNQNVETQLLQGEGKAYGFELLLKKQYGRLNGWLGYTYSRAFIKLDSEFNDEKVNNGKYFPTNFDKPHEVSAILNYKFTKRYSLSTNFIYQSGRPITYPIGAYHYGNSDYTLYSDRNKFRIPDYYRLDIGFNIEGNHKIKKIAHSFWNISIYNVLGRNNPYSIYFVTDQGKVKAYKTSIFSIPIPSVTYNFKF